VLEITILTFLNIIYYTYEVVWGNIWLGGALGGVSHNPSPIQGQVLLIMHFIHLTKLNDVGITYQC